MSMRRIFVCSFCEVEKEMLSKYEIPSGWLQLIPRPGPPELGYSDGDALHACEACRGRLEDMQPAVARQKAWWKQQQADNAKEVAS